MINEKEFINQLKTPETSEQAFRELISLYKERLYWHIRKIVISHDDADDVLQNTFIKVYRSIQNFKGDSKLYSWLYRIATNESITQINKNAKRLQTNNETVQQTAINNLASDVYFDGDEIQFKLQQAIATLPQKQQLVFNMKYFDDLKYSEIAEILETSEGALKASYHIAAKKIQSYLTSN
ncbi:MAG: RNA polymerase sigma factor [Flavobacteriaceae bacterium]|nr:RNA polymerase sigma factor [Flavobacteriaceae bacterium]